MRTPTRLLWLAIWPTTLAGAQPAALTVREDAGRLVLGNGVLTLAFDRAGHGSVVSVVRDADGEELVPAGVMSTPFVVALSSAADATGERFWLSGDAAEPSWAVEAAGAEARVGITWADCGDRGVDVTCTMRLARGDPHVYWSIRVTVPEGLVLEHIQFPNLTVKAPLHAGSGGEAAVIGATKGGLFPQPSAWAIGKGLSFGQPGSLAAQFGTYYDAEAGLLLAAHDVHGYPKGIRFTRTAEGLQLVGDQPCFATGEYAPDFEWVLAPFSASEPGQPTDWRDGADLYRDWAAMAPWCAHRFADRPDVPEWLKVGPAMVRFHRDWLADPPAIERWLTEFWKRYCPPDVPLVTAYWGWEKVATWITPDYFPVFPSDEAFAAINDAARRLGCHSFFWPSGYHYTVTYNQRPDGAFEWDDRPRFDEAARAHAVHQRDGSLLLRRCGWLNGGDNASMCPGDPWTVDWFNQISTEIARRGVEMVQVDQVVGGAYPACYHTGHGHPPGPGLWQTEVFRRQLQTMLQACRMHEPEAMVCFEEPNEHFIGQVAFQDYRDWEVLQRTDVPSMPASVFNYVYHEYLPTFQSNPASGDLVFAAWCLVTGQIPHVVPQRQFGPGPALENGDFERWVGDVPAGWDKVGGWQGEVWTGSCTRDGDVRHGGDASLRLENAADGETVQVSQNVPVGGEFAVGGRYRVSLWLRAEGLARANRLMLGTFTSGIESTGGGGGIDIAAGDTPDWVERSVDFDLPEGSTFLRIMLHFTGPGRLWIDDARLERLDDTPAPAEVGRPEMPADHEFYRRWVELFSGEGRPYLMHGRLVHPPRLDVPSIEYRGRQLPAILHEAYRAADGSEAVVAVNVTGEPRTGVLAWRGTESRLELEPWEIRLVR